MGNLDGISAEYVAGFFDGEGSISIIKNKPESVNQHFYYVLRVHVGNVNPIVLIKLKERWGGSLSLKSPPINTNAKPCWNWNVSTNRAVAFLRDILPYLMLKGEQAKLGLELDNSHKTNKFGGRRKSTKEALDYREHLRSKLMLLNKRGVL